MSVRAFSEALCSLVPYAVLTRMRERSWCSRGLAGVQVAIDMLWNDSDETLAQFAAMVPEHDFAMANGYVADIVVIPVPAKGKQMVRIEALLLNDV